MRAYKYISILYNLLKSENPNDSKLHNTCLTLDHEGKIQSVYDKIHLFKANLNKSTSETSTSLREFDYTIPGCEF